MYKALFQSVIGSMLSAAPGVKITDSESKKKIDTGVERLAQFFASFMGGGGVIELSEPLIFKSTVINSPAIVVLDEGGSSQAIGIVNGDNQYAVVGIGALSQGLVANEFVPHPAWALGGKAAYIGYANTGSGYARNYGAASGEIPIGQQATGSYDTLGGGGGGRGTVGYGPTIGYAGRQTGPGITWGLGPYGTPGGMGPNGQWMGGGGGIGDGLARTDGDQRSQPTGYNTPTELGTNAPFPGSGTGNPINHDAPFSPIAGVSSGDVTGPALPAISFPVLDEDTMSSDSDKHLATQQSIKAYVDASIPTTEEVQDIVGAMFSGNTETFITVTYQDADGTIDLVVSMGIDDLSDVTITAAANGDYLRHNGTAWVDSPISQLLTDIKTVDGTGSGLDADLLDGNEASAFQPIDADLTEIAALANVAGDILYTNATPEWARLAKGSDGQVLTLASGLPSWAAPTGSGWQDDGTVVRLVTTTDQVVIGGTTPLQNPAASKNSSLSITGSATLEPLIVLAPTDSAANVLARFRGNDRATAAIGDESQIFLELDNSDGDPAPYAAIEWRTRVVTAGSEDGELVLQVSDNSTLADMLTINETGSAFAGGVVVGSPTGGNKGAGTINATAVYDDDTLLTDWVFDLAFDGVVRYEDFGKHGEDHIWSIEETEEYCRQARHLPTMPGRKDWAKHRSLGNMVTGLLEMVERQQLMIFDLNQRLKKLGG